LWSACDENLGARAIHLFAMVELWAIPTFRRVRQDCLLSGMHFDGLALRRSRIWTYLIRAFKEVLRMFVVGMR